MRLLSLAVPLLVLTSLPVAGDWMKPGAEDVPAWAQQGRFRFTRLDGGPLEVRKTTRSDWGKHFNEQQKEVLGNLYSKYGDRMADLLAEANINWVWITWSVGLSDAEEAEQRAQCKSITEKLHKRGIRAAAYMCAVSIFWETMFRDHPRAVRWLRFDNEGTPFRYSGGKDALRFIADVAHPEWIEYQKKRVGAIIDAGLDGIFFDNTACPGWNTREALIEHFTALRRYIHQERKSNILLFTNYGLRAEGITLNENMEFVFNEGWREPGAWDGDWEVSNVRRMRYVRGVLPEWKAHTSEYSIFRKGNRATTWLGRRSQKLGILEAAALGSAYCWDMEGPFDGALMAGDSSAIEAWKGIVEANGFLKRNEALYVGARSVAPVGVLRSPVARDGVDGGFTWNRGETRFHDLLSKSSVQYKVRMLGAATDEQLSEHRVVVVPHSTILSPEGVAMVERYKSRGGKVLAFDQEAPAGAIEKIRAATGEAEWIEIDGAPHVLAVVTRLEDGKRLAVHVLNYDQQAVANVRLKLSGTHNGSPRLLTPDAETRGPENVKRLAGAIEFTLPRLDTYAVIVLD
jgi:hypothetical protein